MAGRGETPEARFDSLVEDAKRGFSAQKNTAPALDEEWDPIRAIVVNVLCFLLPAAMFCLLARALWECGTTILCLGHLLPVLVCARMASSKTLAHWVVSGARFFLMGSVCLFLLCALALPLTAAMAGFAF